MKYPLFLKKVVHNSRYKLSSLLHPNSLQVDWYKGYNNFGDILNPVLISYLTDKKILNVRSRYCTSTHLLAIGSVIDRATSYSEIWGSGYISANSRFIAKPQKVHAVRGPLTRKLLLSQGIDCPKVYGDPALLLPRFIPGSGTSKKYKLGIVPHYVDKNSSQLTSISPDVKVIDVQNPNPLEVLHEILSCEAIASSSMHGLILADAYHIPTVWIQLSSNVFGDGFKFHDYYKSIGIEKQAPKIISDQININELIRHASLKELLIDLDLLQGSFPVSIS